MQDPSRQSPAPNYTCACVVMFGVNITWMLMLVWIVWGLIAACLTGWIVSKILDRIDKTRA